jgi:IS5 family transposase
MGLERLKDPFNQFRRDLKKQGAIREIFTFVDASQLKSKLSVLVERDKAIKAGEERLNNKVIKKFGKDKQARIGCKGKDNFWYGYKGVRSVDMQPDLINKANIVPGNVHDSRTVGGVCPGGGAL